MSERSSMLGKVRRVLVGKEKNPLDKKIFHNLSLIAFFAWVGLGADGLSSSCYGPEEAFLALGGHSYLILLVGLMTVITISVICASYSQIIEKFPMGGGGYLVASKLLSPSVGMISGCALLIDYVLTITLSIASGADAVFSFLPPHMAEYKLGAALTGVLVLTVLNLRGVKESVLPLVPVFLIFVVTHLFAVSYSFLTHANSMDTIIGNVGEDVRSTFSQIGFLGMLMLLMRSYSLGAGTYTGIEAVSNGMQILREPRVETGKLTMRYMAISLSVVVMGLMMSYLFYDVSYSHGKTLNAVLFGRMTAGWGTAGTVFLLVTLLSEALILFIAAQTGFMGGPKILANMAVDRWVPSKFASLSDRLVTENGVILMGLAAGVTMVLSKGSVKYMVVLYSINVFITFTLSQAGMVKLWWRERSPKWKRKMVLNGTGLLMSSFILVSVVMLKFNEGGWITLVVTGLLASLALFIKKHYLNTMKQLRRLNSLIEAAEISIDDILPDNIPEKNDPGARTAVLFVNGYNGLGLHSLFNLVKLFGGVFKNYVFVQIGILDAGNFKGSEEVEHLKKEAEKEVGRYSEFMSRQGKYSEGMAFVSVDVISEIDKIGSAVREKFPDSVFFGGQLVFSKETLIDRWLHNYTVFAMQRRFYQDGIPFIILPIRVSA
ncbi:MAG: APC family permease [Candidatus Omnitrophica bacterium]|nr:APC family permease [Candidatus Omnitrophota bacterium]